MPAIASSPIALWIFVAMLVGLAAFLGYAWFTRYRMDWDTLLRRWSGDHGDTEPPPADDGPDTVDR
ncbi:MAG: hypothetical protein ACJ72N_20485 [Labedaea sp.]